MNFFFSGWWIGLFLRSVSLEQGSAIAMNLDVASSQAEENGFSDIASTSGIDEEFREILQQTSLKLVDDHLVEFSEALRSKMVVSYLIL